MGHDSYIPGIDPMILVVPTLSLFLYFHIGIPVSVIALSSISYPNACEFLPCHFHFDPFSTSLKILTWQV